MTKPTPLVLFKIFAPTITCSREPGTNRPRMEGIASSTIVDGHGDEITLKALKKMAAGAVGLTMWLNHEYKIPDDVFGMIKQAKVISTGLKDDKTGKAIYDMRIGIEIAESNPIAMRSFEMQEKGEAHLGLSIGAMVPDGGATVSDKPGARYIVDDLDLVEVSFVGIPANPRGFVDYAVKSLTGKYPEKIKRSNLEEMAAQIIDMPEDEVGEDDDDITALQDARAEADLSKSAADEIEAIEDEDTKADTAAKAVAGEGLEETKKTKVSIWETEDGKTIEVDTGRGKPKGDGSQSAQDESSDTAGGQPAASGKKELGDESVTLVTAETLRNSNGVVKALSAQLTAVRAELIDVRAERDAALALARESIESTNLVIEKLRDLPIGRQTGYVEATEEFKDLQGLYDEGVLSIMRKSTTRGSNASIQS